MTPRKVIGIGAGGHAKVVLEILKLTRGVTVVGLLDSNRNLWGKKVLGVPVLGDDSLLPQLYRRHIRHAFIGLGCTKNMQPRIDLFNAARREHFRIVHAIHPSALISTSAVFGEGVTIMAGAIINAAVTIGENVIVNTGAIVEHDGVIESHVHIATGARLASTVHVSQGAHVGLGASIRECIRIGKRAVIGAGAVVVKDVPANCVMVGIPARPLRSKGKAR